MSAPRLDGIGRVSQALLGELAAAGQLSMAQAVQHLGSAQELASLLADWRSAGLPVDLVEDGLRWSPPQGALSARNIVEALAEAGWACPVEVLQLTDSTNTRLLADKAGPACRALLAESQRAGRGRLNRRWLDRHGQSLLMSLRVQPGRLPREWPGLAIVAGVAVATALAELGVDRLALKWPNDILLDGAKLGGILVETAGWQGPVVIGLGLNWSGAAGLASELGRPVAALADRVPVGIDRNGVAAAVLASLLRAMAVFADHGVPPFVDRFASLDALVGRPIRVKDVACDGHVRPGIALGLAGDGRLRVRHDDGEAIYHSAEVSLDLP